LGCVARQSLGGCCTACRSVFSKSTILKAHIIYCPKRPRMGIREHQAKQSVSESGVVVYSCDICNFTTLDPARARDHETESNRDVRNPSWRHSVQPGPTIIAEKDL